MFDEKGIQKRKIVHEEYLLSKNQDGFALRDITNRLIYSNENRNWFFAGSLESLKQVGRNELKSFIMNITLLRE